MRPLHGVRVLDLSRLLPGGACTLLLADLGADVVNVEHPNGGDGLRAFPPFHGEDSAAHVAINRGSQNCLLRGVGGTSRPNRRSESR